MTTCSYDIRLTGGANWRSDGIPCSRGQTFTVSIEGVLPLTFTCPSENIHVPTTYKDGSGLLTYTGSCEVHDAPSPPDRDSVRTSVHWASVIAALVLVAALIGLGIFFIKRE